jgi:hypothetical protein
MADFEALKNRFMNNSDLKKIVAHSLATNNKFHSIITEAEGIKFSSKKEARVFRELQARQHMKDIKFFLMQVPFLLPGVAENGKRTRHYLDFLVVRTDGQIEYVEVKGRDLPMGKLKRRQTEELYGIKIQVV